MADPTDTRDTGPRAGSPLWTYLTAVTVVGTAVLVAAQWWTDVGELVDLAHSPLFWTLAVLVVLGELRPVMLSSSMAVGGTYPSTMFTFAALLHYGLPVALLVQAVAILVNGAVTRRARHRVLFNVAQVTLAYTAAGAVLGAFGHRAVPAAGRVPAGNDLLAIGLAGLAYFVVRALLVSGAVALHERRSIHRVIRTTIGHQSLVYAGLLGLAPLVVVVMNHSPALVPLFVAPMAAVYFTATLSVRRDHQAMHDGLTGLPNRKMLVLRTEEALAEARAREGERVGLLLLDLDRFKEVNDTLGHPVGDRLLQMVAHRLTHSVRPGDVVARLGGDEFAVLLPSVRDAAAAREVAARLRVALTEPARLEGMTFDLDASVGIALYPDHAPDFELLMQRSDVAMYLAKEGRSGVELYLADKDRNSPERLSLLGDLRRAIDRSELRLHYQPKLDLAAGQVRGVEALLRWRHPVRGMVSPGDFVPLAEQSYLMRQLTEYVIDAALEQAAHWWHTGLHEQISVNVSARDLLDSALPDRLEAGLARYRLPPKAIQLEVTERILMTDQAYTADAVRALASLGVPLALDDFGTGYSSLVRLQRLPVSEVKIDASFVRRICDSRDDERIVRSIVDLVRSLGLRSVAEGVESAEVAARLAEMGCDLGQGWWFAEAMSAVDATAWLREHRERNGYAQGQLKPDFSFRPAEVLDPQTA
ncbi:putative bifunctional diguanylate cyclase/phosphodiesterase [Planomonospora venezuelensis]|uniref:Diguanylate cyclase (GGDEF)-like protein n=1 Tax=Planomonospora venezuelensis TaxID=1999 RepID=A0A841D3R3_PLAVE|nr:EAL domain-containing protein [Planomonospora venezuelensis]MBB5963028.1 diguanylate cyclase (GGDEF)-like protein [Planomonospora venezuelensis]GIN00596.1 GGDEF-domain containing protein [Planomonospora venezuelensis]